jgi:AcrR family transcriptional regulator
MSKELSQLPNAREQIITAYLKLLEDYSPQQISVKQIVAEAAVSRSTFYLHFEQKEQIQLTLQTYVREQFLLFYHGTPTKKHGEYTTYFLCQHILKYRNYYKWAFQQPDEIHYLSSELEIYLARVYEDDDYAIFASYGTVGYLKKWVEEGFVISPFEAAEKLMKIGFTNWADSVKRDI